MVKIEQSFANRRIVLGVTGGIAAYKSADLVRRLCERGARVRVVMTAGATSFVTTLTFQALSGNPVHTELLDASAEAGMGHIELARWADLVLIAPATANCISRLANGQAGDLLSTICLATEAPLVLAPAMNRVMWLHPATRTNCKTLEGRGVRLLGPGEGSQACGETGHGRMLEPLEIIEQLSNRGCFTGLRFLITAGPTFEDLDPVRFIGNRSSGKMGFAVAEAAAAKGAVVELIAGPVDLETPASVTRVDVRSAAQMHSAVMQRAAEVDVFVAAAAVADFAPEATRAQKIKKGESDQMILELRKNPDILAAVAAMEKAPFTLGFAAETHDVISGAKRKLMEKGIDMIAANQVGAESGGFDREENELTVLWRGGEAHIPMTSKGRAAAELLGLLLARYNDRNELSASG